MNVSLSASRDDVRLRHVDSSADALSLAEREKKEKAVRCPKCESGDVRHVIELVNVTTSRKS